ncbi:hypothetical protein JQ557_14520 [Bradyrhizobium sp. U87765 SZCCT0131]|uniref:hypothetical protein n=1 Tax=unclassified Bradyrhizobium TaxID=2631580 RepID=UPI001BA6E06E|nr:MULTISPECIES: hypothetical protein [unclassified Bradyrhizobium]MBR1219214.1 hypothetical protein [Bradyrhizobium sp. U87765 SZCCT0131]MBR1261865.1 hypothetical protein [Bradyrhizobium sp. U87765 SZCCT0134]MBR1306282.1 hypothetical protein [Bradyrhizobium sp. U87765 SZCCT0110]MBR1317647.1 hypothetical protein [Bradyrhizobium sp. U87765 SZCCT0109]MBR1351349.1 hypothetical protein [Bradyrhizobium sp. U87765 SZCCT0048]
MLSRLKRCRSREHIVFLSVITGPARQRRDPVIQLADARRVVSQLDCRIESGNDAEYGVSAVRS